MGKSNHGNCLQKLAAYEDPSTPSLCSLWPLTPQTPPRPPFLAQNEHVPLPEKVHVAGRSTPQELVMGEEEKRTDGAQHIVSGLRTPC